MTENLETSTSVDGNGLQPVAAQPAAQQVATSPSTLAPDRPEMPVAAAFAGGFALAMIIRRLAR